MQKTTGDPRRKTALCEKWQRSLNQTGRGHCPYGKRCDFAHGLEELRNRPPPPLFPPLRPPLLPPPPPPPISIHVHLTPATCDIAKALHDKHGHRTLTHRHALVIDVRWEPPKVTVIVARDMHEDDRNNIVNALKAPLETVVASTDRREPLAAPETGAPTHLPPFPTLAETRQCYQVLPYC